jgi:hypothetical protein
MRTALHPAALPNKRRTLFTEKNSSNIHQALSAFISFNSMQCKKYPCKFHWHKVADDAVAVPVFQSGRLLLFSANAKFFARQCDSPPNCTVANNTPVLEFSYLSTLLKKVIKRLFDNFDKLKERVPVLVDFCVLI